MGLLSSRRRPSTAPNLSLSAPSTTTSSPTSSLDLPSSTETTTTPETSSASSSDSTDSPEMDFNDFLNSAPREGELKIFGEPSTEPTNKTPVRPRPISFLGSSTSTTSSALSASASGSSRSSSRRFSLPRSSLSASASSFSNLSDARPVTPGASSSFGIGFVRMTTKSGGVCYVAEEVAETKDTITFVEEEGDTASKEAAETRKKEVDTQKGKKMKAVEASKPSLFPKPLPTPRPIPLPAPAPVLSSTSSQAWTPPSRPPPPTPSKASRRHTMSHFASLSLTRRPAPTRLSILCNPPSASQLQLRDLANPPSAWKTPVSSPIIASGGSFRIKGKKRGDPNVEAAVTWLRERKGTYGGVLKRLGIAADSSCGRVREQSVDTEVKMEVEDGAGRKLAVPTKAGALLGLGLGGGGWVKVVAVDVATAAAAVVAGERRKSFFGTTGGDVGGTKGKKKGGLLGGRVKEGTKRKGTKLSQTGGAGEKVGWRGKELGGNFFGMV